jgi:hypothetical protein
LGKRPRTSQRPVNFPKIPGLSKNARGTRAWVVGGCVGVWGVWFIREWAGLPRGTYDTCQLLIGRHRFKAYIARHVANIDTCHHPIRPNGTGCHVLSADWSVPLLMPLGVDTWQPRGIF